MSANFYPPKTFNLRNPLLSGSRKDNKKKKGKITYFNSNEENSETIDETLDKTIYNNNKSKTDNSQKQIISTKQTIFNIEKINSLEVAFKIATSFITAIGGTFCLLQLINIIRIIQAGSYSFGNNMLLFVTALIATIVANIVCIGFIHMVKTTKYIYMNLENQTNKLNHIFSMLARVQ